MLTREHKSSLSKGFPRVGLNICWVFLLIASASIKGLFQEQASAVCYMEGKGEGKRNQGGKLVAKGKSRSEERLFASSSNYKTSAAPRRESSSELPVIAVTLVLIKVSLATGKHRHSQMPGICLALRVIYCFKSYK